MANQMMVIAPYWADGTWVFDDPGVGLGKEPFMMGAPAIIDVLVKDIPDARTGFRLLFSVSPFPGGQQEITWVREELGGNWYALEEPPLEGWLCSSLFHYFEHAPTKIYVRNSGDTIRNS